MQSLANLERGGNAMNRLICRLGFLLLAIAVLASGLPAVAADAPSKPAAATPAARPAVSVAVDARVELICIVFRLAGHPEYNRGRVKSYVDDVERQFGPFRNHAVVALAQKLRRTRGVSFDACMSMAVHLTDAERIEERVPFDPRPDGLDARWPLAEARTFVNELRKFAAESRFAEFFAAHRSLYETAEKRMQGLLDQEGHLEWFPEYFGERPGARFTVALALLNGPSNYGPHCRLPDGKEELYCILGAWETDAEGLPRFSKGVLETVVHEFCHSHTNAIVDRHEAELKPAGEKLYARVAAAMERQAYGQWKTMMYESLVRACTIRYVRRYQGTLAGWWKTREERGRQFAWVGELADLLAEYETGRDRYRTLDAFAPRIVKFFNEYAEKAAREPVPAAPRAVSVSPADGATDVDPGLKEIRVVFDRPMQDQSWSLVGGPPDLPEVTGRPKYDAARTTWTVPIRLQPGTAYRFMLNSDRFRAFRSADGVPLEPVTVRFKTAPRRSDSRLDAKQR
jgi:hypothetical protein